MATADRSPHSSPTRLLLAAAAVAIVIAIAIVVVRTRPQATEAAAPAAVLSVTTTTLHNVELARGVVANGSIRPWQEIIVGPEVGGYRVAAVRVDIGDRVKRGQELVLLSDELLSAEVASRRASAQQAAATLENAAAAFRRAQSLSASGLLSQADLDRLRSEEMAARARVEVAAAELDSAELRLRYTRVTAPDDGVISARTVAVGQIAQIGGEMLRMVRQGRVEWRAEIPESRLKDIKAGQHVQLTTADGTRLEGKVRTVSPTVDSSTRAGLVYVDIDSSAALPGMFARGEIVLGVGETHMLPVASVVIQDGYSYAFVVGDDGSVERHHVDTGVVKGDLIEILAGVTPHERVVHKGAGFLKDGDRVNVVRADTE